MAKYNILLAKEDGEVIGSWIINTEIDFDIEDLDAEESCDDYLTKKGFENHNGILDKFEIERVIARQEGWI